MLKVFQSSAESAPVVVPFARAREIPDPEIRSPLSDPETKLTLLLNRFQSPAESAPVAVQDARPREIPLPAIERPFAGPEIKLTLLLNVVQSRAERAPVLLALARASESPVPASESPFPGVRIWIAHCLLLKRVQSAEVRSHVAVFDAYGILKVWTVPTELMLKVVPADPTANVCDAAPRPLRLVIPAHDTVDHTGAPPLIVST